jgi:hypothetical protein
MQLVWAKREIERLKVETASMAKVPIDEILADLAISGGSDLHIKDGRPADVPRAGDLMDSRFPVLDEDDVQGILLQVRRPTASRPSSGTTSSTRRTSCPRSRAAASTPTSAWASSPRRSA